jgi:hypothetical protein
LTHGCLPSCPSQLPRSSVSPLGSLAGTPLSNGGGAGATPMALSPLMGSLAGTPQPSSALNGTGAGNQMALMLLPARSNPHKLFIREPPPGTEAAQGPPGLAGSSGTGTQSPGALTPVRGTGAHQRSPQAGDAVAGNGGPANPFTPLQTNGAGAGASGEGGQPATNGADHAGGPSAGTPRPFLAGGASPSFRGQPQGAASPAARAEEATPGGSQAPLPQLGRLAAEGYHFEPGPTQLGAMHAADPESLAQVGGGGLWKWLCTVGHDAGQRQEGSVREPS